jgi:hypothetical protein
MIFKQGVGVYQWKPALAHALHIVDRVYLAKLEHEVFITSINDGTHMDQSKHYLDDAFDTRIRINNDIALPPYDRDILNDLRATIAEQLGRAYDVVLESDHIHVEFDPKI